jgi:hypothetical protein
MFRFTRKPSSGSQQPVQAKITHLIECGCIEVVQTLSVLRLHPMTCKACVLGIAHTPHRTYYAAIILLTSVRPLCSHIETSV